MLTQLTNLIPPETVKMLLVLFLSFLIGLEREEHQARGENQTKSQQPGGPSFGGVRTFPLIGLIGYALTLLSGDQLLPVTVGFAVIGGFLWISYRHKLEHFEIAGATTEVSALATYVIGALVSREHFWIATAIAIIGVLLLELKEALESLSRRLPGPEVLAFTKFLLLTAVILPVLPDRTYGPFGFNPFKTWLIVVAASGISYGSYLLQKALKDRGGVIVSAVLGGAYSSTVTTVVLAKRSRQGDTPHIWAGGILMASGMMYLRILVLIGIFNRDLARRFLVPFLLLGFGGLIGGWLWSRIPERTREDARRSFNEKNPLELSAAFLFALLFAGLLAATYYVSLYLGRGGVLGLAAISGLVDVDPFILGMTQAAKAATPLAVAASAIVIAAASNSIAKACYAFGFAERRTGIQALGLLLVFAVLGLLPLAF